MGDLRSDGAYFALFVIATLIWFSPASDWQERLFSIGLLFVVVIAEVWKRLKQSRDDEAGA